jgi:glyoxylase-like metal-dependent hydrolase (beta-lactamase superfamily II)
MSQAGVSTANAISSDSGRPWADEGAWPVAEGVYRIPLPLPLDALRAVNVYVLISENTVTLIDGGWAVLEAEETLDRSLRQLGIGFGDIDRFLVTHVHRDHYTLAITLGRRYGAEVSLGAEERPTLDLLHHDRTGETPFADALRAAGAGELVSVWASDNDVMSEAKATGYQLPTSWLVGDHTIQRGGRSLDALHTPGHTPGHFSFAEQSAGLLFAGDHVLPTITPSIGFVSPTPVDPLGSFMRSLTKVRALPDTRLLPAHGPVAVSTHARVDELLAHHEHRLELSLSVIAARSRTACEVAAELPWTRHERHFDSLDPHNRGMAAMETMAHLDLLVARGRATATEMTEGIVYRAVPA